MLAHTFLAITAHKAKKSGANNPATGTTPREAEPETSPPIHRRLIALTLAEIRRLLNLDHRAEHAIAHGLHWSTWRRQHQADARRAHARRHLRLQTLAGLRPIPMGMFGGWVGIGGSGWAGSRP